MNQRLGYFAPGRFPLVTTAIPASKKSHDSVTFSSEQHASTSKDTLLN